MGVLTDIVVAQESEAERIAGSDVPAGEWPGVAGKGMTFVEWAVVWAAAVGDSSRAVGYVEILGDGLLSQQSDDGPWVFKLPEGLVDVLAGLDSEAVQPLARALMETEEFGPPEAMILGLRSAQERARRLRGVPLVSGWAAGQAKKGELRLQEELAARAGGLAEHLRQVSALARTAKDKGKQLLLRVCL